MAKEAIIRSNPEETQVEFETPDGEAYGPLDWPDDNLVVLADETDPNKCYLAVLSDEYGVLKPDTLYHLTPVATLTEEVDEFEDEEEEEEEAEDEPAEGEPAA